MASFVRKNELIISGKFHVPDSPSAQPDSATVVLTYKKGGTKMTDTINLSLSNGVWSGTWDSSASDAGRVDWMIYGTGAVVAATQGFFMIEANKANTS